MSLKEDLDRAERIKARFDWTHEEWAGTWLPHVRMAAVILEYDEKTLEGFFADMAKAGELSSVLDSWHRLTEHLCDLAELTRAALTRSYSIVERLGDPADNPLPNSCAN